MLVPRSHGGAKLDVPSEMRVIEELARADGSVGWTVMIGGLAPVHTPAGDMVARRIHLCEVRDGRISAVTTYCNGGWDAALRARHAAEAPMIRA